MHVLNRRVYCGAVQGREGLVSVLGTAIRLSRRVAHSREQTARRGDRVHLSSSTLIIRRASGKAGIGSGDVGLRRRAAITHDPGAHPQEAFRALWLS